MGKGVGVMIEQNGTFNRLIKAIEKGAELRIDYSSDFEGCVYLRGARLVHDYSEIKLDKGLAVRLSKHADIREGYPGYRSDYGNRWSDMFEHKSKPVARWITEQWGFDS